MKFKKITASLIIFGIINMASNSMCAPKDASGNSPPQAPKLETTIDVRDLGSGVMVRKLAFSRDSRYLAIVVDPEVGKTDIVIWDMQTGRRQAHFHCTFQGVLRHHELLWNRDGTVISFGATQQWNPMTGAALPDNPAIGHGARLNKDGSKMFTILGAIGEPSNINVYDTETWTLHKVYMDGLEARSAAWTADDKIVINASATRDILGKVVDHHTITDMHEVALRLLDPYGNVPIKTEWFAPKPTADEKSPLTFAFQVAAEGISNFARNEILLDPDTVINGTNLNIFFRKYQNNEQKIPTPGFGMALSPDGTILYLKGAIFRYGGHLPLLNSVVDISSAKVLFTFEGATEHAGGIAASSDGKYLALGGMNAVCIFRVQ